MLFEWKNKESKSDNPDSGAIQDNEPGLDKSSKNKEYFSFSNSEKKYLEESIKFTKDLQNRAKPIFYDQVPTLSNDEIIDGLFSACLKEPGEKYDATFAENTNNIVDSLMEYKKYDQAAEFLKKLDVGIPVNYGTKERIEELENYFKATNNDSVSNKEAMENLQRAKMQYSEAEVLAKEKKEIKKSTTENIRDDEKKTAHLGETTMKAAINNPRLFINQALNLPVAEVNEFLKKFEESRLDQIGITESRSSIAEKIDYIKDDLIKKLMAVGDYTKALYFFDDRTGSDGANKLLCSIFSAAAKNNDTKTIKIIEQTVNSTYDRNRFPELREDIQEYLSVKEGITNSIIESLAKKNTRELSEEEKLVIPDRRLNKKLVNDLKVEGRLRQS